MMQSNKVLSIRTNDDVELRYGKITEVNGRTLMVDCSCGRYRALRAFGCIVDPQVDDRVLISIERSRQGYVLEVVDRPVGSRTDLSFPGDVNLRAEHGELKLAARSDLSIGSGQAISQSAPEFRLVASKAIVGIDFLTAAGARLVSKFDAVQTLAESIEILAGHLLQKVRNSLRITEGVDQTKAGDSVHTVDNLYSVQSRQSAILARKDIKIDAERIHMG